MASRWHDPSTASRWLAVSRRDPAANSSFLYGATTTLIFCRPTCPGRLARRANVVFFESQDQALRSGYRPCKRCEPCNAAWWPDMTSQALLAHAESLIRAAVQGGRPWTVAGVAREMRVSVSHLHRQFRKHYGLTPKDFAASLADSLAAAKVDDGQGSSPLAEVPVRVALHGDGAWPDDLLDVDTLLDMSAFDDLGFLATLEDDAPFLANMDHATLPAVG